MKKVKTLGLIILAIILILIIGISLFNLFADYYIKKQYEQIPLMTNEEVLENMTNDEKAIVSIVILDNGKKEIFIFGHIMESWNW